MSASETPEELPASAANGRRPKLLKDQAYAEIKHLIQSGEFAPGIFLSERQLAARLAMSKTPIRAALEHLDAQGLVAVSPQQGITVRDLSLRAAGDLFELRTALESYVARQLAGRITSEQAGRLRQNLAGQQSALAANDPMTVTRLDIQFHVLLCELLGNPEIERILRHAFDKLYRTVLRITLQSPGRLADSCAEHAAIAEAVITADPALAARRMEDHLRFGRDFQRAHLPGSALPLGGG